MDEEKLILNVEEEEKSEDTSIMDVSITLSGGDDLPNPSLRSDDLEKSLNEAEEIRMLLEASPKKDNQLDDFIESKTIKMLVPITIAGGCVQIRVDEETRQRSYYNDYYFKGEQMTKDENLWSKMENDEFEEDEERPDVIEIKLPSSQQLIELYKSLGLYKDKLTVPTLENVNSKYRLNCVLIRGVTGLSTNDMFLYLRTYQQFPMKLEWINDTQCIAVFANQFDAGRCILELSKPIKVDVNTEHAGLPSPNVIDTDFDLVDQVPITWVQISMPPTHVWRFTVASFHDAKEKPGFLLTIPLVSDKKQPHAESLSEYYRLNGNPNWKERQSLWTKAGYQAKMKRKRMEVQLKKQKSEIGNPGSTRRVGVNIFDELRLPIKSRLGIPPAKRKHEESVEVVRDLVKEDSDLADKVPDEDKGEQNHQSTSALPAKASRREITVVSTSNGDEETDGENWKRPWNGYQNGMVADVEEVISRRYKHLKTRRPNRDSRFSAPRRSIQDRLGW